MIHQSQLKTAITNLIRHFANEFKAPRFVESIKRTFISKGSAPNPDGSYELYSAGQSYSQGYMHNITPTGTQEPMIILEEIFPNEDEEEENVLPVDDNGPITPAINVHQNIVLQNRLAQFLDGDNEEDEEDWDDDNAFD